MQCSQCQAENREGRRFCAECGAPLSLPCSVCAYANEAGEKFCGGCGAPLATAPRPNGQPTSAQPAPRFTSPETYTPLHLAERIISSRGALEGERKQVTVLFADLKGSMELLADRDPEEARRILDPVLERMMEAVHRYEGTVNQVMGDGIMALFGAPLAHEDHAVRACYAALRMQEAVQRYAEDIRRTEGLFVHIRVGLNSGEVVVRSIGSDLRMDYTAIGQTTHLAARMEQLAAPGSILLAPDTLQLAEGYVHVKTLGPMAVKGLKAPVEVYELLRAGTARSRLQATVARGLTKFVGRDTELETLRRTLDQAGGGHGQVVALVGEPGVGKSRLVWEFTHSHRTQGWLVLESGSVSYGKATSYLPVIDLLKSYCGIESQDDHRRIREKLLGKLLALDRALEPTLPALLALLDVPVDDSAWEALDPPQRRQRTLDAVKRLLLRESQEQPLLLVCEDLHWIDAETQALLDSLVDSLPAARTLLLVNYRPEYEHTWHRKTYYQQLRLDPLPPASAAELLVALLGESAELDPLKRLLTERTEGNPFFIEESVRALVESGALAGERGSYRPAQPIAATQVPATVQAVLAARIDRLAPEDKRLLQAAAVIGKDVPYRLLQAIAQLPEDALGHGLGRLQAAEFLYETSLFPDLEYTFKHALTHEVTYGSLLQDRRRALHGQIVAMLERLHAERLTEQVERLAHHALHGEIWEKAADYLEQAGNRAVARSTHREAVRAFEQALVALGHLPGTPERQRRAIDLHLRVRHSLITLGEIGNLMDHLSEAERLATALQDQHRLGRILAELTNQHGRSGDYRSALAAGQRARAIAAALGDHSIAVSTNHYLTHAHHALGQYEQAIERETENLVMLADDHLARTVGGAGFHAPGARAWLADCLAERGEFAQARTLVEEAEQIAVALDHPFTLVDMLMKMGIVFSRQGEYELAWPRLERALNICEERQVELLRPYVALEMGHVYTQLGQPGEALTLLTPALEWLRHRSVYAREALAATWLAEAELAVGSDDEALTHATYALTRARARGERGNEARALRLLGEIAAHADPPDASQAESYYRQALALAEQLGMRPLAAHCHLGLGTLSRKVGRHREAQAELTTATDMYRGMEMPFWLAKAETALSAAGRGRRGDGGGRAESVKARRHRSPRLRP